MTKYITVSVLCIKHTYKTVSTKESTNYGVFGYRAKSVGPYSQQLDLSFDPWPMVWPLRLPASVETGLSALIMAAAGGSFSPRRRPHVGCHWAT